MKSLLQTKQWIDFKVSEGWQIQEVEGIFVLGKKLPMGKMFWYTPEIAWDETKFEKICENIKKIAKNFKPIFFRLEINEKNNDEIVQKLKENGFIKAFEEVQPEHRQIIDITKNESEILTQMKEKGRYNIKVAQRNNVKIETSQKIDDFYELFKQTAKRDGFQIRSKQYFTKLLDILLKNNFGELLIAKYNGETIAAEIVTYYDETASYLYGASSNEDRNVMAPYLMHLEAMLRAKARGCKYYDLLAVNPEGDEKHKFSGIGRFKRQFGGETIRLVGSWDLVFQPFWYKLFEAAEKIRRK